MTPPGPEQARFSFVADLYSRDGGLTKDARNHNAFLEVNGQEVLVWQRPALGSGVSGLSTSTTTSGTTTTTTTSTGLGQGLVVGTFGMYILVGGTLNKVEAPVQLGSAGTSVGGIKVPFGGGIYSIDFDTGGVYRAIPTSTSLNWTTVSLSGTTLPSSGLASLAEAGGYIYGKFSPNGSDYGIFRTLNGITWETVVAAGAASAGVDTLISNGGAALLDIPTIGNGQGYDTIVGTTVTPGTMASSFSCAITRIGYGGGCIWALGRGTGPWSGTQTILAQSVTGASWSVAGTGTTPFGTGFGGARIAYSGGRLYAAGGTSGTGIAVGITPYQPWSTVGTFAGPAAYMPVLGDPMYLIAGSAFPLTTSGFSQSVRNPIAGISASVRSSGFLAHVNGTYVIMQGTEASYVYNVVTGTSGVITGTNFPGQMVPGMVYLNATYYVMEPDGTIWNSTAAADDPTTWPTDGFISAQFEPDGGVALTKALNYVVALGQWSTELFWDAANPTGSPLLPVNNGVLLIGCASAGSVAQAESTVIWIAQRKGGGSTAQKGRFIAMLVGTSYQELSSPSVNRILDADSLATVYASIVELGGHTWYILGLAASNLTLVYDLKNKKWYTWSRLAAGTAQNITSLTASNGVATGTLANHGFSDGDPVIIAGGTNAYYNGTVNVSVNTSSVFTYPISTAASGTAGGSPTAQGYTESLFDIVAVAGLGNTQLVQDSTGNVYTFALGTQADLGGIPINLKLRTNNLDGGNVERKFCHSVAVMGDILSTFGGTGVTMNEGLLRHSDNDFGTNSPYRRFDLTTHYSSQNRWGNYRRRAWEWRYTGTGQFRLKYLEPEITQGVK